MSEEYRVPAGDEDMYVLNTASWRTFRPVIDEDKCRKCGTCLKYCPVNSVKKTDGKIWIDYSYCKGCGICRKECPFDAIAWTEEK